MDLENDLKPVPSYVSERSPVQVVKVKVPKIDYTGLHVRQVEFERRKQEWIVKI